MGDMLKTIRAKLVATTDITDLVSADDIRVGSQPIELVDKQIILMETLEQSEPTLVAEHGIMTITVYVKDTVQNSYAATREVINEILTTLNKQNENLTDADSTVRFFIKDDADYVHNNEERYWMAAIVFSYVEGE